MIRENICYEVGFVTDPGNVREENQDSLLIRRGSWDKKEFLLLAVADGMGGLASGKEASSFVVNHLNWWWEHQLANLVADGIDWDSLMSNLTATIDQINWNLYELFRSAGEQSGTTLTLAFVYEARYIVLQTGDSRAYRIHKKDIRKLTKDQSWCQREVDAGRLSESDAEKHPMRHILISSLGLSVEHSLDHYGGSLDAGDGLLLCSDGFYNEMDKGLISAFSRRKPVQKILDSAAQRIKAGAADDNLTAILVRASKFQRWGK